MKMLTGFLRTGFCSGGVAHGGHGEHGEEGYFLNTLGSNGREVGFILRVDYLIW